MTRHCTLSISIIATRASGSIDGFAFTRYSSITLYCLLWCRFQREPSRIRSTPFLPSKLKTRRKERSWAELRLKNISIQWLSFTVVVIRFKRHSFFNNFLFKLSIEIKEFCSKIFEELTLPGEPRHGCTIRPFGNLSSTVFLASCFVVNVCMCIRVFYFLILSRKQRHAVPLSTLLVTVTNKLKEFIIHALLLARIEHVHISPVERSSLFWMSIIVTDSYVCIWCIYVCVCVYMRVDGWLVGSLLSSTVRRTVHEIVRSRH